jgi:hypothetical protein
MLNAASSPSSRPGRRCARRSPVVRPISRRSPPAASGRQAADDDARVVHAVEGGGVDGPPRHYRAQQREARRVDLGGRDGPACTGALRAAETLPPPYGGPEGGSPPRSACRSVCGSIFQRCGAIAMSHRWSRARRAARRAHPRLRPGSPRDPAAARRSRVRRRTSAFITAANASPCPGAGNPAPIRTIFEAVPAGRPSPCRSRARRRASSGPAASGSGHRAERVAVDRAVLTAGLEITPAQRCRHGGGARWCTHLACHSDLHT